MANRLSPYNQFKLTADGTEWSGLDKGTPSLDLTLPHGAKLCATGLVLPDELDLDQWEAVGRKLMAIGSCVLWALAEWWAFGDHKYAERALVAKKLPYDFGTLMNYGRVARKVPTSSRNEVLSFTHHMAVAKLEPDDQKHWLARAVKNKWSVKQLEKHIHEQEETHHDMDMRDLEKDDPVAYRKHGSRRWGTDFIEIAQNSKPRSMFGQNLFRQPDDPLLGDLSDDLIGKMIEAASSVADMWIEIVDALKQHQKERTKPKVADDTSSEEDEALKNKPAKKKKPKLKRERMDKKEDA